MAFKSVVALDADVTIALGGFNKKQKKENPISIEGYYLGSKTVLDVKKKDGKSFIHILQTSKGNVGVWGKTDLDKKVLQVVPGTMIRATHTGMRPTPNGEMYVYNVEQDKDNTIDVVPQAMSNATSNNSVSDTDDEDEAQTDTYSSNDADEEEELQNAALLAAERKAKVQALLANKSKKA